MFSSVCLVSLRNQWEIRRVWDLLGIKDKGISAKKIGKIQTARWVWHLWKRGGGRIDRCKESSTEAQFWESSDQSNRESLSQSHSLRVPCLVRLIFSPSPCSVCVWKPQPWCNQPLNGVDLKEHWLLRPSMNFAPHKRYKQHITMTTSAKRLNAIFTSVCSYSVVSDSLGPFGLYPTRPLCPWDFSG